MQWICGMEQLEVGNVSMIVSGRMYAVLGLKLEKRPRSGGWSWLSLVYLRGVAGILRYH
jgi:hypothetical protein